MKKVISWALCILWMGVIFGMSAMPGDVSGEQSGTVTKIVLSVVSFCFGEQAAGAVPVDTLEFIALLLRAAFLRVRKKRLPCGAAKS